MDLVPIKVKIGLKPNGYADYPKWTSLPSFDTEDKVKAACPDGWLYDHKYGHKEEGPDSPKGMQWGVRLVTRKMADEALAKWPALVTELTEAEFDAFYEGRATVRMTENRYDTRALQGLQIEFDLREKLGQDTTVLKAKIAKALDPDDDEPGIKRDIKKASVYKTVKNITIKSAQAIG